MNSARETSVISALTRSDTARDAQSKADSARARSSRAQKDSNEKTFAKILENRRAAQERIEEKLAAKTDSIDPKRAQADRKSTGAGEEASHTNEGAKPGRKGLENAGQDNVDADTARAIPADQKETPAASAAIQRSRGALPNEQENTSASQDMSRSAESMGELSSTRSDQKNAASSDHAKMHDRISEASDTDGHAMPQDRNSASIAQFESARTLDSKSAGAHPGQSDQMPALHNTAARDGEAARLDAMTAGDEKEAAKTIPSISELALTANQNQTLAASLQGGGFPNANPSAQNPQTNSDTQMLAPQSMAAIGRAVSASASAGSPQGSMRGEGDFPGSTGLDAGDARQNTLRNLSNNALTQSPATERAAAFSGLPTVAEHVESRTAKKSPGFAPSPTALSQAVPAGLGAAAPGQAMLYAGTSTPQSQTAATIAETQGASLLMPTEPLQEIAWDPSRVQPGQQVQSGAAARVDASPMVMRQIMETLPSAQHRPVEIALSPQELGRVRISVVSEDRSVTVQIIAERPETLDLMRRHIDQLGQNFRQMGYENVSFSFGAGADGGEGTASDRDTGTTAAKTSGAQADAADTILPIHLGSAPSAGLDLRL